MRASRLHLLWGLTAAACTALNHAYDDGESAEASSEGPSTSTASTTTTRASSSTSGSSSGMSSPATSAEDTGASTTGRDVGVDARDCWAMSVLVDPPAIDRSLVDVPLLVELSGFGRPPDGDTLRFLGPSLEPLPHELERSALAWVRVSEIQPDEPLELLAVMGPECDPIDPFPPSEVWSNGYVAVFHFDGLVGDAFVDSVHGIALDLDDQSAPSEADWALGGYVRKAGNGALLGGDPVLDLAGATPVTALAWVRLASGEADPLPWVEPNARHREIITKIPGYRLTAVRGQTGPEAPLTSAPFFNVLETTDPADQNLVDGPAPVLEDTWTMLAGIYDGTTLRMHVDDLVGGDAPVDVVPQANGSGDVRVGQWLRGDLDEIRVASVARPDAWLAVQYASMRGTLLTYGRPKPY